MKYSRWPSDSAPSRPAPGALMAYSVELCRDYLGKAVLQVVPPSSGGFG